MTSLISTSSSISVVAVALLLVAITVTLLLGRGHHTRPTRPSFIRRRLGIASEVVRWVVISGLLLALLFALGVDLHGLWSTLLAVLSLVAIGFVAMWSILSHMLASVLIVAFRPFEIGDRVEIVGDDPVLGEVVDLNLVYTTLRTDDGATLQIPNNLFFQRVLKRHASGVPPPAPIALR